MFMWFSHSATKHNLTPPFHLHCRTFLDARVKWVRDPYLDTAVQKEKNLKELLSLKALILSQPSKTLPMSSAAAAAHRLNLPTTAAKFMETYPSVFQQFHPIKPLSLPHVRLTPQALSIHKAESQIIYSLDYRRDAAERLAKLLMLTRAKKLPLPIIEKLRFDLGLPQNFILTLLPDFPDYFQICSMGCDKDHQNGSEMFGLELISWRNDLAVSALERKARGYENNSRHISFPMDLPRGFDLRKKVTDWVSKWQKLPYLSPYEDAFHLSPRGPMGDQAEKWTVAVLHELLHLLVSKKTEKENLCCLGDYLGFGTRFKKVLVHHPGIFYTSNKIRTQTVVLREAYKREFLVERHLLMGMRYRFIHLMNKRVDQRKLDRIRVNERKKRIALLGKERKRKENARREEELESRQELESNGDSDDVDENEIQV